MNRIDFFRQNSLLSWFLCGERVSYNFYPAKLIWSRTTLDEALIALKSDTVLTEALGSFLTTLYIVVRRSEADAYRNKDVDFEIVNHFYKY